jgi:hypothetical protein
MDTKDLITLSIAGYAACLATYTFIVQRRDKNPKLKITTKWGVIATVGVGASEKMLFLYAANVGEKPMTIASWGLKLPDKSSFFIPNPLVESTRLPHELTVGKSCTVVMSVEELEQSVRKTEYKGRVKLIPWFSDQTGKIYEAKSFQFPR